MRWFDLSQSKCPQDLYALETIFVTCRWQFPVHSVQKPSKTTTSRAWDKWSQWSQSHSDIRSRFLKQKESEWSWWTHEFSGLKIIGQLCGPFARKRAIDVVECIILPNVPTIRLMRRITRLGVSRKQVQPREWKGYNFAKAFCGRLNVAQDVLYLIGPYLSCFPLLKRNSNRLSSWRKGGGKPVDLVKPTRFNLQRTRTLLFWSYKSWHEVRKWQ